MTAPHPEAALSAYEPARRFAVATWGEDWANAEMSSLLKFSDYVRICERQDASSRLKPGEPGAFQEALDAIREAISVNDGDTLSRLTPDNSTIWAATGSWSHPARVNLGHLRALSTAHTATAGDGGLREAAQALLTASIEDYGLDEEDADDEPVAVGVRDDDEEWKSAVTFGHLRGLQDALAQAPALQAPAGEGSPIDTAPLGQEVRIQAGEMTFLAKLVPGAGMNMDETTCDQWQATREGEHPECWSEGACYASNADEVASLQPTRWWPVGTPTDAQPKAARPVGDEAQEDQGVRSHRAFQKWKQDVGYASPSLISFQAGFEAAEAAHPTTGHETVATPRDGGVREALEELHGAIGRLEPADGLEIPSFSTPDELASALGLGSTLSATGSAGPGDDLVEAVRFKIAEPHFRKFSEELSENRTQPGYLLAFRVRPTGVNSLVVRLSSGREIFVGEDEWTLATPSPAQEPGFGDTGEAR